MDSYCYFSICNGTDIKLNVAKRQTDERMALDLFVSAGGVQSESCARSRVGKEKAWALSSCSSTTLWPFHADDWFRCGEQGEERSGSGLCPLITLHYRTGGIYHQTPKASVRGEHWNQSLRLHAIHPGPRKAALWSATTSIFSVREGGGAEGARGWGRRGSKKAENDEEKRDLKGLWDASLGTAGGCFCLYLVPMSLSFIQLWLGRLHFIQLCKKTHKILQLTVRNLALLRQKTQFDKTLLYCHSHSLPLWPRLC